jgi:hypothetical protein
LAHYEVFGLDVSMQEAVIVQRFDPVDHLDAHHASSPQVELFAKLGVVVRDRPAEQLHYHDSAVLLLAEPVHLGHAV